MKMKQRKKGYTLIELMLSITFLASLAIIIALLVSNSAATYRQGLVLKKVNLIGSEILEDFRSSMSDSHVGDMVSICDTAYTELSTREECRNNNGYSFVTLKRYAPVTIKGNVDYALGADGEVPVYGAFCTGKYSYVWNSGYFYNSDLYTVSGTTAATFTYKLGSEVITATNFRLLKIYDETRQVCVSAVKSYATNGNGEALYSSDINDLPNTFNISNGIPLSSDPIEMITDSDGEGIAIYDITVARPSQSVVHKATFFTGSFVLGSINGGVDIGSQADFCKSYIDKGISDKEYCAVNRFNFAVQASTL